MTWKSAYENKKQGRDVPKKVKKLAPIQVTWIDSCAPLDIWRDVPDASKIRCVKMMTLGYLLREDKESISVVNTAGENGQVGGLIVIPKCSILKRTG